MRHDQSLNQVSPDELCHPMNESWDRGTRHGTVRSKSWRIGTCAMAHWDMSHDTLRNASGHTELRNDSWRRTNKRDMARRAEEWVMSHWGTSHGTPLRNTHDSFIYVTWFIYTRDMTHSYTCITHSYTWGGVCGRELIHTCNMTSFVHVTWLIHTCNMTSFVHVTWLIHTCDMPHSSITWLRAIPSRISKQKQKQVCTNHTECVTNLWHLWRSQTVTNFLVLLRLKWFGMNKIRQSIPESKLCFCFLFGIRIGTALIDICDVTHSYMWRDPSIHASKSVLQRVFI